MWSDNETKVDLLDFSHLLAAAEALINSPALLPATIGIYGRWGSGKTSLMKMLEERVNEDANEEVLCVSFNGWLFEGYEDAKIALLTSILTAVEKNISPSLREQAGGWLRSLWKRVNWMKLAFKGAKYAAAYQVAGETGVAIASVSDIVEFANTIPDKMQSVTEAQVQAFFKDRDEQADADSAESIRDFHKDFQNLLKAAKIEKLIVFIDDLDRCNPDTIIATLEAIKLFLFAPQSVFVIGADEDLVRYAVTRRFPEIPSSFQDVGRDYLEKLIQFAIRIPPLSQVEMEIYVHLLFVEQAVSEEKHERARLAVIGQRPEHHYDASFARRTILEALGDAADEPLRANLSLASQITPLLNQGLSGNPRQTKRFLNMLMMRRIMATARDVKLQTKVLAKLMLLEYIKKSTFSVLADLQAKQQGKPIELMLAEQQQLGPLHAVDEQDTDNFGAEIEGGAAKVDNQYVKEWLVDEWLQRWLSLEPRLSDVDLRPYFYFSRDRLTSMTAATNQLTPDAQRALADLQGKGDIVRRQGMSLAKRLNPAEASSLFVILADRVSAQDSHRAKGDDLDSLLLLAKVRPELHPPLITRLGSLSEASLPSTLPLRLEETLPEPALSSLALELLVRWSQSEAKGLASGAKQLIGRLEQGGQAG